MLSKTVLDAMRYDFYDKFDALSEKDVSIQKAKSEAFALFKSIASNDSRIDTDVEDAITALLCSASLLGFYIGLKTSGNMIKSLINNKFADAICGITDN